MMDRREAIKRAGYLTGFALSAGTLSAVLQGCQPEVSPLETWVPKHFSLENGRAVAYMAERIIPHTDTPGAIDVFVHDYLDNIVGICMLPEDQARFDAGLAQFLADFSTKSGKTFLEGSETEQLDFLNAVDQKDKAFVEANPILKPEEFPFFLTFKQLVLTGYFTSEPIATEVLGFNPIPGEYDGCMPYEAGTPNWYNG
ncbi:MAG TPA: gluconate 2-dehydrogenase subunit 3 family protein [Saprospiraceae bacterium]|nr:gluconate 2-dehydrogenase subunit 3 family protein [Saprospiraceae bacterium]HMQ84099.1 gluconate 2-dehydrogenase subunit 3 family protein [Saprospiraceae bacterium]